MTEWDLNRLIGQVEDDVGAPVNHKVSYAHRRDEKRTERNRVEMRDLFQKCYTHRRDSKADGKQPQESRLRGGIDEKKKRDNLCSDIGVRAVYHNPL